MMSTIILVSVIGLTAECKEGMRDDPVMIVHAEKNHYIYFLPDEMSLCKKYATAFERGELKAVCGCKILKDHSELDDRLRLRCAYRVDDKIRSRSMMWFYYYPQMTKECKRIQKLLMRNY